MNIKQTDHFIQSSESDCRVQLRNKHLQAKVEFESDRTVLFVHGATYASSLTFDYAIEGESWMDSLARQGFDVWALDLVGYGQSDRPAAMDMPPQVNSPICDTSLAVDDLSSALAFIKTERRITNLHLIGYSWGTAIASRLAGEQPASVNKLVLCGALWVTASKSNTRINQIGAYRTVDVEAASNRWGHGLTKAELESIVPQSRILDWCRACIESDPRANDSTPPVLRAPAGVIKDFTYFSSTPNEFWYQPGLIKSPTLIVVGEWDKETTPGQCQQVFELLENVQSKRLTVLGRGTHSMLLENQRHELHQTVAEFLSSD